MTVCCSICEIFLMELKLLQSNKRGKCYVKKYILCKSDYLIMKDKMGRKDKIHVEMEFCNDVNKINHILLYHDFFIYLFINKPKEK